ncbi:hypothetical protein L226DRAFT_563719 [Lentinus tigrinus ALCF2SS1-7]|uniref:Uncharacterized protein n=1 Tax=Lentinus tigrinus ALCF2SS1-6 TaxID=1328759 RepID=A0A5C2RRD4_9APHY|nr:hypothetical protein L227DRAFT_657990 [Lentinus tigrinus ALCF2SS1-6]RPD68826.1 hypothetical protein L226DRAFT_563719 [Lentinus tigrinus ALCF2SS1-7]
MDAASHGSAEAGESSNTTTSSSIAGTSAAGPSSHNHDDDPPCHCWSNFLAEDKRVTEVTLNFALPPVRAELGRGIKALEKIISLAEHSADQDEGTANLLSPEARETFSSHRDTVVNSFETATEIVTTTPGYVCRKGSAEHERRYSQRHKALTDVEDELTRNIEDAEPLFKARDELLLAERRMRRRKYAQAAFRTMSIVTIPFFPLLSALFTAADMFGLSVVIAIQKAVFPDAGNELGETLERVVTLEKDLQRKVAEVKRLKDKLETRKAKLEERQQHPIATQLAGILRKIYLARHAAEGALFLQSNKRAREHLTVPIRDVVSNLRGMGDALESPEMITGPIASLSDDQCAVIDRALAILRTSPIVPATIDV